MRPALRRTLWFLPFIAVSATHLVALFLGNRPIPHWTKGWLMVTLLAAFIGSVRWERTPVTRLLPAVLALVAGIGFSWIGDTSLLYDDTTGFLTGLGAFLIAHLAYVFAFFRLPGSRKPRGWIVLVYLIWFLVLLAVLGPETQLLLGPVALYGLVLALTGIVSSTVNVFAGIGGGLFVFSDSILGANRFVPDFPLWQVDFVIMVGYIGAQLCIVFGAVLALARSEFDPAPRVAPDTVVK